MTLPTSPAIRSAVTGLALAAVALTGLAAAGLVPAAHADSGRTPVVAMPAAPASTPAAPASAPASSTPAAPAEGHPKADEGTSALLHNRTTILALVAAVLISFACAAVVALKR